MSDATTLASPGPGTADGTSVKAVDGAAFIRGGAGWIAVHSARDPLREADAQVTRALGDGATDLLVVIGLGLGHVLEVLTARQWPGRVLSLEPEPALVALGAARPSVQAWLGMDRLRIIAAPAFHDTQETWRWFDGDAAAPPILVNPPLARVRPDGVRAAMACLERLRFGARANVEAQRALGARYLLNTLANIPSLARERSVLALQNQALGRPAVVIGAGPSLDQNLSALRDVGARAVIIAVDTALRPLLTAGIAPDYVVALDASEANARHLCDLPACPGTSLVAEASLDPVALDAFRGRTFFFSVSPHQPWPWLESHGVSNGRLDAWGSVLTAAFDLARRMGCHPVVFAGADLAFTDDRAYCAGITNEIDWRRDAAWGISWETQRVQQLAAWTTVEAPGVHGAPVRTAPHLLAFRDWIVEQAQRRDGPRIINATGGGVLSGPGVEQAGLATVVAGWPARGTTERSASGETRTPAIENAALLAAAASVAAGHAPMPVEWLTFADGLTADGIRTRIGQALAASPPQPRSTSHARARARLDEDWIEPLVAHLPLVPMRLHPNRMEAHAPGLRRYRFRTASARVTFSALRLPDEALCEDDHPLRRLRHLNRVATGDWCSWRDELLFGSLDGTDPRHNGRAYTLLVPPAIAYLEALPLNEILTHGL
ncbi:MAG: DUF115 domain-containing protein [Vicinamibacterales bacterium]|nr:DUF115 domain-containing protein [Vicinamibacterales bacterium]